jgi:hypothetical protein
MSAPLHVESATAVGSRRNRARLGARLGALAVVAAGVLLIIASATAMTVFTYTAHLQNRERARWLDGEGQVVTHRRGIFVAVPDPDSPGGVRQDWQVQPEVELEYDLDGAVTRTWVAVPMGGRDLSDFEAQIALGNYPIGESVLCWLDPDDLGVVRLTSGDGGRGTAIFGCAVAFFLMMPGVGLIFTGWLWRRFRTTPRVPADRR